MKVSGSDGRAGTTGGRGEGPHPDDGREARRGGVGAGPVQAAARSTLAGTRRRQEHCRPIQPTRATSLTRRSLSAATPASRRGSVSVSRVATDPVRCPSPEEVRALRVTVTPEQIREAFEAVKDDPAFDQSRGLWERGKPPVEMLQAMCLRPEILRAFGGFGEGLYPGGLLERQRAGARDHHGVARERLPVLHQRPRRHRRPRRASSTRRWSSSRSRPGWARGTASRSSTRAPRRSTRTTSRSRCSRSSRRPSRTPSWSS